MANRFGEEDAREDEIIHGIGGVSEYWKDDYHYMPSYNTVKKLIPKKLLRSERERKIRKLTRLRNDYLEMVFEHWKVRRFIYDMLNDRQAEGYSISSMSRSFDKSKKGYNTKLEHEVDRKIRAAFKADENGDAKQAAILLREMGLNNSILYGRDIASVMYSIDYRHPAVGIYEEMQEIKEYLLVSVARMIYKIAGRKQWKLNGRVVEFADLFQEGMSQARIYIDQYEPIDGGKTFTTYIYLCVSGKLNTYLSGATRVVNYPQRQRDRAVVITKAIDQIGASDLYAVAALANDIYAQQKNKNSGRDLAKDELFTAEEVHDRYQSMQIHASLDAVISTDEFGHINTYGDHIEDEREGMEEYIDDKLKGERVMKVVEDYATKDEYTLMRVRWSDHETVRGVDATAKEYTRLTGKPMSKAKVMKIEQDLFDRIRRGAKLFNDHRLKDQLHD